MNDWQLYSNPELVEVSKRWPYFTRTDFRNPSLSEDEF